ncbi:hypothetical protein [Alkalibacterium sp. 20]|uniref:hypothetical protein n=1 Tax=Alkalibacterium sp. 20 TaxID=1798803 RepID=UPI0009003785|nr:hypothetical protein [Alkalibacterium sp. 20]OJF95501.1 hypothetical protein AX762_06570 [Alkalibacterium sp. 20]
MNKKWIKLSSVALLSLYLAACDTTEEAVVEEDVSEIAEEDTTEVVEEDTSEIAEEGEDETEEDLKADDHGHDDEDHAHSEADSGESIEIEGMDHHYHTGALVELTAVMAEDSEYEDWHWYMRADEESEWEVFPGQNSNEFFIEAPEDNVEIRAVLYDNENNPYAESTPIELAVDNH